MQKSKDLENKVIAALKDFGNSNSDSKIVGDMSAIVKVTSDLPLLNLDYWERLIRTEVSLGLKEPTHSTWRPWSKPRSILSWLDFMSWDGRKQEIYVRYQDPHQMPSFSLSPYVGSMTGRHKYAMRLDRNCRRLPRRHTLNTLRMHYMTLLTWNSWGRITHAERDVLLNMLADAKVAESLLYKLINSTSGPIGTLFSQLARTSILDDKLELIASSAKQPAVRAKAYRSLQEGRLGHKWVWTDPIQRTRKLIPVIAERKIDVHIPLFDLIKRSAKDRSPLVRRISAEFLIRELENLGETAKELAEGFASEKSRAVSERGHFALKRLAELKQKKHRLKRPSARLSRVFRMRRNWSLRRRFWRSVFIKMRSGCWGFEISKEISNFFDAWRVSLSLSFSSVLHVDCYSVQTLPICRF